jgi:exopolyphosphatase / guanosine-5'-triphosphate,3'-diphosphate pyrophosphatase
VRLLPAGILVLDAAAQRLGRPLQIGRGGLREGVLLDMARSL